jgi:NADPH-dependent 2,4-dienoyl-CoA reductase/sulfur reductase-like enzyme
MITGIMKTVAVCVTIPCLSLEEDGQLIVELSNGRRIPGDMVVLVAGVMPECTFVRRAGLEVGSRQGIRVNPYMQTSDSDIYAVGDAVETTDRVSGLTALVPLAGPAIARAALLRIISAGGRVVTVARWVRHSQGIRVIHGHGYHTRHHYPCYTEKTHHRSTCHLKPVRDPVPDGLHH